MLPHLQPVIPLSCLPLAITLGPPLQRANPSSRAKPKPTMADTLALSLALSLSTQRTLPAESALSPAGMNTCAHVHIFPCYRGCKLANEMTRDLCTSGDKADGMHKSMQVGISMRFSSFSRRFYEVHVMGKSVCKHRKYMYR